MFVGLILSLLPAPYLARLTLSVPDRADRRWWRGQPASRRRVLSTAVIGAGLGAAAGAAAGWSALLPAYLWLALICTPLVTIDIETHRLPDRLTRPGAVGAAVLLAAAAAIDDRWGALVRAAEAAGLLLVIGVGLAAIGSYGLGDVKLGALLAAYLGWAGWIDVFYGISAGFVLGALAAVPLMLRRRATMRTALPFGPALIAGTFLVAAAI
jgi:leader peptidase (prepilin peptidase)/N-methyltransferase